MLAVTEVYLQIRRYVIPSGIEYESVCNTRLNITFFFFFEK